MRTARIKADPIKEAGTFHCISPTVNGEFLLEEEDREALRIQLWKAAAYCGLEVLTYTILSNHFHVLVRVPLKVSISDTELLRRYETMYPRPTIYQTARLEVIKSQLAPDGPAAVIWRERQLKLMGDVSVFMKLVKMRFSIWHNRRHQRFGTLWAERLKSTLVDDGNA